MCQETPRHYACAACYRSVLICPPCDRGNIYCAGGCAEQRRRESMRRAGSHYQKTSRGKRLHAARQAAWRLRNKKVTHQGSDPPPETAIVEAHDPVPTVERFDEQLPPSKPLKAASFATPPQRSQVLLFLCSFCQRPVSEFLRLGRLRR